MMRWTSLAVVGLFLGTVLMGSVSAGPEGASREGSVLLETGDDGDWPALEDAEIRPGVNAWFPRDDGASSCTTNFVFHSSDRETLYIGTAGHCVTGIEVGDRVEFPGSDATGTLYYAACRDTCQPNDDGHDFAIIEIDDEHRDKVHPKVLHWGGPAGVRAFEDVGLGERILWYGNSSLREIGGEGLESDLKPNEGWVCSAGFTDPSPPLIYAHDVGPAWFGDSGAPVLMKDGSAAGILVGATIGTTIPGCYFAATTRIVPLSSALEEAREDGVDVELATWDRAREGDLPEHPFPGFPI